MFGRTSYVAPSASPGAAAAPAPAPAPTAAPAAVQQVAFEAMSESAKIDHYVKKFRGDLKALAQTIGKTKDPTTRRLQTEAQRILKAEASAPAPKAEAKPEEKKEGKAAERVRAKDPVLAMYPENYDLDDAEALQIALSKDQCDQFNAATDPRKHNKICKKSFALATDKSLSDRQLMEGRNNATTTKQYVIYSIACRARIPYTPDGIRQNMATAALVGCEPGNSQADYYKNLVERLRNMSVLEFDRIGVVIPRHEFFAAALQTAEELRRTRK